jgi:outer membrane protein
MAADNVLSNEIRVGAYIVMYDAKADDLTGPYVPPGVNVDVKNVNTPYFAYLRRLGPHFVGQLSAGVPPKTETVGKGPATLGSVPFNGQVVSTAKWFSPSLIVNYVFRDESQALRPYLGAGVNYTRFYDLQSTPAGDAANGGPTAISLSSSVGPVVVAGLRWHIKDHWSAYASYDMARVNSDYVGDTAGVLRRTHIKFNPSSVVLAVGYAF